MKDIIAALEAKRAAGSAAAVLALLFALCASAWAQDETEWSAPNDVFSLAIPDMWNVQPRSEPEVLLFLRSLGRGPSGPSAITCSIERHPAPVGDVIFTPEQLNSLNQAAFANLLEHEQNPISSTETVAGVQVASYEATTTTSRGLSERHIARVFLLQEGHDVARYLLLCGVMTVSTAADGDLALTRTFLSSLHIHAGTTP